MPVHLTKGGILEVDDGNVRFAPTAEEIYSVVFEGQANLHGTAVNADDFLSTGLDFSRDAADPIVILETNGETEPPEIRCHLLARLQHVEAPVSNGGSQLFDYGIGGGRWLPLPIGTTDDARQFLTQVGLPAFGQVTLGQYMKVMRTRSSSFTILDRTAETLRAASIAPHLTGDPPASFKGNLFPYQLDGYRWLSFMHRNSLGAIIADEMGLGKTVQVICLLLEVVAASQRPNLVVAPATLLENWRRELFRFGPHLDVLVHAGSRRTGFPDQLRSKDIVIASFETAVSDISLLRNVPWNLLVVDEAQGLKNPGAKRAIQLKTVPRKLAIAVTGTPVENRLKDLWSITDLVLPSFLGTLADFERDHPDTSDGAARLEPLVSPIILRRRVSEVARDLPERIDIPQPLELDEESSAVYDQIRAEALAQDSGAAAITSLTRLRMFCTHPWLAGRFRDVPDPASCCVKLRRLLEILDEIFSEGGKALIFTSYQESIDILVSEIQSRFGVPTDYIDGRVPVPERQAKVDKFSSSAASSVLVLNPKAAGTGLNITAANHVIHYNLEWNPAVEDQASARAHRRGQTRPVTVHRFFYADTVEEVINDRMSRKRQLADAAVVGTDGREQEMNDILRALKTTPYKKG